MPNLGAPKAEKKESKRKSGQILTAELLANEIVNMRSGVAKTQRNVSEQLKRTLKMLKGKLAKKPDEKVANRVSRLEKDLKTVKTLAKDEVSKFALVNKKTKNQLPFTAETPAAERCLYHLATEKTMIKAIEDFRKKYEDSEVRTAYFLQRLGAQYQGAKEEKKAKTALIKETKEKDSVESDDEEEKPKIAAKKPVKPPVKEKTVESEDDDEDEQEEETDDVLPESEEQEEEEAEDGEESEGEQEEEEVSDVDMGSCSEDEETIENRRKMLFELCGIKEDKARPKIAPKPKKLAADEDDVTAEATDSVAKEEAPKPKEKEDAKALLKNIVQKTLTTEAPKSTKNLKKLKSEIKLEKKQHVVKRSQESDEVSTTVVKKVKLSEGGVVELKKSAPVADKEDSDDSDSSEAPVSSFFLSADGSSSRPNGDSSGEESVDDDADIAVTPLPKKGGEMRQMSAARQKLHEKLEQRPFERQKKMAQNRKEVMKKGMTAGKGDKSQMPDPKAPETLHPSWAARVQKKKELEGAKPQGKRVVFDDDD